MCHLQKINAVYIESECSFGHRLLLQINVLSYCMTRVLSYEAILVMNFEELKYWSIGFSHFKRVG